MSFKRELLSAIRMHVVNDPELKTILGVSTLQVIPGMAPQNTEFPYICFAIKQQSSANTGDDIVNQGKLYFDVWTYGTKSIEGIEAAERLIKLFNKQYANLTNGSCRFWYSDDFDVPTMIEGNQHEWKIRRRAVVFDIRMIDGELADAAAT